MKNNKVETEKKSKKKNKKRLGCFNILFKVI